MELKILEPSRHIVDETMLGHEDIPGDETALANTLAHRSPDLLEKTPGPVETVRVKTRAIARGGFEQLEAKGISSESPQQVSVRGGQGLIFSPFRLILRSKAESPDLAELPERFKGRNIPFLVQELRDAAKAYDLFWR